MLYRFKICVYLLNLRHLRADTAKVQQFFQKKIS